MSIAYQYDASGYYAGEVEAYGLLPNNATATAPTVKKGFIPRWTGKKWTLVEDHKGQEGYVNGQPHTIKDFGPLPKGWSVEPPDPSLEEVKVAKLVELKNAYDRALAGAIALADPSPTNVALEAALWAVEDAEGLQFAKERLSTEYKKIGTEINTATTVEAVDKVEVKFLV